MGCLNAKLVPGVNPDDGPAPETVYTGDSNKAKQKGKQIADEFDDLKIAPKKEAPSSAADDNLSRTSAEPKQNPGYRLKIDPRVTAKYDIKALIGKGSFSRVVRSENRTTKQPYAIKIIHRVQGKELYEAELSVLRRVKHKYVIQLVEVFESRDKVYMVMELATGGELFDRIIAKGNFSESDAIRVTAMLMEGLRYLHSLGITHRDLKPENLLYYHPGHDSKILITDFGLSATRGAGDDFMQTTCGTPEYIAPEILARKPYNCLVDEWAAGVIVFIMLSGSMPFDDDNRSKLYRQILKAKYSYSAEPWKHVSHLAKDFINNLLELDVSKRMPAAQALKHPWLMSGQLGANHRGLHRAISNNLVHRQQSTRANSTRSSKSNRSNRSNRSTRSLRSEHRRVLPEEIEQLHKDPDFVAELSSLSSSSKSKSTDSNSVHSSNNSP